MSGARTWSPKARWACCSTPTLNASSPKGRCSCRTGASSPLDLLVLATGYANQQEVVRASLGDADRRPRRPGVGLRRGRRAAQHVAADGAGRALVHRREPGPVPDLLQVPRPADQGSGRRTARLNRRTPAAQPSPEKVITSASVCCTPRRCSPSSTGCTKWRLRMGRVG